MTNMNILCLILCLNLSSSLPLISFCTIPECTILTCRSVIYSNCCIWPDRRTKNKMLKTKALISFFINPLPLRWTAIFPKSANKDTVPVNNIPFDSHWSAYLRIDISSYEGGSHFERNWFKMQKWTTSKMNLPSTILDVPLNYSLFRSS